MKRKSKILLNSIWSPGGRPHQRPLFFTTPLYSRFLLKSNLLPLLNHVSITSFLFDIFIVLFVPWNVFHCKLSDLLWPKNSYRICPLWSDPWVKVIYFTYLYLVVLLTILQPNKRWWKKTHISHKVVYKSSSHYTKIEPGRENTREIRGSCYTLFLLKNVVLSTGSWQIFEVEANLNHTFPIMHQDPGYYTYLSFLENTLNFSQGYLVL